MVESAIDSQVEGDHEVQHLWVLARRRARGATSS
jgi:hypothetical protein